MMGYDGYSWLSGIGGIGPIVGVLIVVALVAWLVWGAGSRYTGRSATVEAPVEILRRRHAAGEIDQSEYEQTRKTLV